MERHNLYLDPADIEALRKIAEAEEARTKTPTSLSALIRRAISEFIARAN